MTVAFQIQNCNCHGIATWSTQCKPEPFPWFGMAILKQRMDHMALELERARMTAEDAYSDFHMTLIDGEPFYQTQKDHFIEDATIPAKEALFAHRVNVIFNMSTTDQNREVLTKGINAIEHILEDTGVDTEFHN